MSAVAADRPAAASMMLWERQPEAALAVERMLECFLDRCPEAASLAERMRSRTGTRFRDWVDHIALTEAQADEFGLSAAGYEVEPAELRGGDDAEGDVILRHPGGVFPRVRVSRRGPMRVGLKVERVGDFAAANQIEVEPVGMAAGQLRIADVMAGVDAVLCVVERHGSLAFIPPAVSAHQAVRSLHWLDVFRCRERRFDTDDAGFAHLDRELSRAIAELGRDWTCDLFFQAERDFWQRRNRAAQVQKARQDLLGLGWANHDHHTYRSSRLAFRQLVAAWEKLGFACRERFTPGREAGWGAQVMEQPVCGVITFNDVDASPDELLGDFAHEGLDDRHELATVGLWCALHGEAVLQAGMHHLEGQFDFTGLTDQLRTLGVGMMKPFSDFPHLKQAFTEGERWAVDPARVERLLARGQITQAQADAFLREGAIGSHLENLERNDGFKGFNQKGITEIIAGTDPRRQTGHSSPAH